MLHSRILILLYQGEIAQEYFLIYNSFNNHLLLYIIVPVSSAAVLCNVNKQINSKTLIS